MALKGGQRFLIRDFKGLNSFASRQNLTPDWFYQSDNIIITNDGSAAVLRSPATFNDVISITSNNTVLSAFDYQKTSGHLILFDLNIAAGVNSVQTYVTTGTTNTLIRSNQTADHPWKSLTINDWCYRINGTEFVQTQGTSTFYAVGITSPATIPVLSYNTTGIGGTVDVGVTASYAYRNSVTTHVSAPSVPSVDAGSSTTNSALVITHEASSQAGVDGIVFFISEDGGDQRYLFVDQNGDPVVQSNITGTTAINLGSLSSLDTLTPEPLYNLLPPQEAYFMFRWRDRICLLDFRNNPQEQSYVQYSALESCYIGVPQESYPPLNLLMAAAKGDKCRSGIETPVGGLILGENDAYLIRGELSDKTIGPEAETAVTESLQPLNWSIGTRSPNSLKSTPFGVIWLDQNKRIQLWTYEGFPTEIGLALRSELVDIMDTDTVRDFADGMWFQHGKTGGHYALVAYTNASQTQNKMFIVTLYRDPETGDLKNASAVSSIGGNCLLNAVVSGRGRAFIGGTGALREILDLELQGAGWLTTQDRYFRLLLGNETEFCYWHSIRLDITTICGLTIWVSNMDGSETQEVILEQDTGAGGAWFGMLDVYGYRKQLYFTWDGEDTDERTVLNLRVAYSPKPRLL